MKRLLLAPLALISAAAHAQDVPMADQLRADGKIWVVVATLAIVLAGFFYYLIRLDRKVSELEKRKRA